MNNVAVLHGIRTNSTMKTRLKDENVKTTWKEINWENAQHIKRQTIITNNLDGANYNMGKDKDKLYFLI